MKFVNLLIIISLLLTLNLSAKTYEDGEDKKINRWELLMPSSSAIIKNIDDKAKGSQVIQFSGNGTKDAYILMINASQNKNLFHWQMKYSEDFVIFISLDTRLGKRYLIYTPGSKNGYMQYGLGSEATSGTWQRYSRNLEDDLKYFDNRNSIVKVNSFVIRGSGSVDNIKTIKDLNSKRKEDVSEVFDKTIVKIEKKSQKVEKSPLKIFKRSETDTTPTITIEGENPYFLALGEAFEELGVSSEDKEDGELVVTSSENINKYKDGEYIVIYMATDSAGNSAIDKRYVIVGEPDSSNDIQEVSEELEKKSTHTEKESPRAPESKEEDSDAQYRLEERELEIAEWERELQFREKEISQREKSMLK